jgi:hypothetical protein
LNGAQQDNVHTDERHANHDGRDQPDLDGRSIPHLPPIGEPVHTDYNPRALLTAIIASARQVTKRH